MRGRNAAVGGWCHQDLPRILNELTVWCDPLCQMLCLNLKGPEFIASIVKSRSLVTLGSLCNVEGSETILKLFK